MKRSRHPTKQHAPPNLILEEVIGLTTENGNGLASTVSSSKCAFIAGCVVVLYDVDSCSKSHLMVSGRMPKPLSCVDLSRDANVVAAGESGHQPAILVWDCTTLAFLCELKGHQYGVTCMAFLPSGKHLASVGFPRDGYLCLWDWRNKNLLTKIKVSSISSPVTSVGSSSDEKFIVTAGKNHLKFWKVNWSSGSRVRARSVSVTLQKNVDIHNLKDWSFVSVTFPSQMSGPSVSNIQVIDRTPCYAVTERGCLYVVYPGSSSMNSVDLEVQNCYALSASNSLVACACNNGVVKLFRSKSLKYAGRLCHGRRQESPEDPHTVACHFLNADKLVVVYNDRSLYIWDLQDISKATRCCVLISHGGCIWDIKNIPCENMRAQPFSRVAKGSSGGLSFATCSADGTVRLWDLVQSAASPDSLCLTDNGSSQRTVCLVSAGIFERDCVANCISSTGFRSMAISSDGNHLAAGDFHGNIHAFNLFTSDYKCIQGAHDAQVLSLCFNLAYESDIAYTEAVECPLFLASGGQDGKVKLFDVRRNFRLFGHIDDHSSAVTVVKVARSSQEILSCDAARSLFLHRVDANGEGCKISCLNRMANSGKIYDMHFDHLEGTAVTVGQDKKISANDIQSGKLLKSFEHAGDVGDPIKVTIDSSCSYLACCYSNNYIRIFDYKTGDIVAHATGHSDVITGIVFLPDFKHLISVGADGCIFVWKLPAFISSLMLQRNKEVACQFLPENENRLSSSNCNGSYQVVDHLYKDHGKEASANENQDKRREEMLFQDCRSPEIAGFKFSISRLPKWAQCKVIPDSLATDVDSSLSKVESQIPSKDIPELGEQYGRSTSVHLSRIDSSAGSLSPPGTSSAKLNHQWLTIYTVCMDPHDSPKTYGVKGSATDNRRKVEQQITETSHFSKRIKLSSVDPRSNDQSAEPKDKDVNDLRKSSHPDNLGNLSADLKAVRDAAPSSRRLSIDTLEHNCADIPLNMELVNSREREACNQVEEVEIVQSCEEALHNLETAAETTLHSFCKLSTTNIGEGKSRGSDSQFRAKAVAKLQLIERKIHSIAKLLQPASNSNEISQ